MALLKGLLWPFQTWNDVVLPVGRWISIVAIALMVLAILVQVFFRYVLNNALPWPDEAARFMMLWLTGLMAPIAFRRGGFVSIDMAIAALPERLGEFVSLVLLALSLLVLVIAIGIGYSEITGFNANFKTSALWYPTGFGTWEKVPRWWMQSSLFVGVILLTIVNIELILRTLITLLGHGDELKDLAPPEEEIMAE